MELTAQPWAAGELLGPSSPTLVLSGRHSHSARRSGARPIQKIYRRHEV